MKRTLGVTLFWGVVFLIVILMGCSSGSSDYFITRWEVPDSTTLYFPLQGNYQFRWHRVGGKDYTPWHGAEVIRGQVLSLRFDKAGVYDIEVKPTDSLRFQMVMGNSQIVEDMLYYDSLYIVGSNLYLREIRSWGKVKWYSMRFAFAMCEKLQIDPYAGLPNLEGCPDCVGMFYRCTGLSSDLSQWKVGNVQFYLDMFYRCPEMPKERQPKFRY